MTESTGGVSRASGSPKSGLASQCWSTIVAVPALIWASISGIASIFGILGITLFDGRSIVGPAPEWVLRKSFFSTEPAAPPTARIQDPAVSSVQSVDKTAQNSGSGISLGMQPTTYATLPPAHTADTLPVARVIQSPFSDSSSGDPIIYTFNNRDVGIQAVGDIVQVRYVDVRREMADNGVKAGDLFVEFRLGGDLSGTARLRSRRCGVAPYDVTGTSEDNYRVIKLRGEARKFDENCRLSSEVFPMSIVLVKR